MKKIQKITQAAGLALVSVLTFVSPVFAADITPPDSFFGSFSDLINKLLTFVMAAGALMVFLYLIWGGIDWITSGGDKTKTEGARNKITAAVIGLIILAAAWAILSLALNFLSGGDLNDLLEAAKIQ